MDKDDKRKVKIGIAIAAFAIVFYLLLQNFSAVTSLFGYIFHLLSAFIIGIGFAFVLNLLMCFIENKILSHVNDKKHPKFKKLKRPIAVIITVTVFLGICAALISFVLPQLASSVKKLVDNFQTYLDSFESFANKVLSTFGISTDLYETITNYFTQIADFVINFLKSSMPQIFETTKNITSGVTNVFLGFIIGIYMLASKESLLKGGKRMIYAFVPTKGADYIVHVYRLVKARFSGFVTGQLTEAVIVGVLCFIGMSIFRMEYALLISVIVGVTNMIPIIGPIIGAIPGALIMLLIDPMKALWFVIFMVVLQQVESNLIYPKVVGDSIGLPGIWVLFAILIGGSLFQFTGVLLGVPVFAVIYTLIGEIIDARLKQKQLKL